MVPCKFQSDATGRSVMVYSQDGETVFARTENAEQVQAIRQAIGLPARFGKVYAMARQRRHGALEIGEVLEAQEW